MASFLVTLTVEAPALADAEAAVSRWTVGADTTLVAINGQLNSDIPPLYIADGGPISGGVPPGEVTPAATAQISEGPPPEPTATDAEGEDGA